MTVTPRPDPEDLIRAEVERAVAPYLGKAPPVVLRKLRQLSERYWRENAVAVQALRLKSHQHQVVSGTEAIDAADEGRDLTGTGKV